MIYDIDDAGQRRVYQDHLRLFIHNICSIENLGIIEASRLLPSDASLEVSEEALKLEIAKLSKVAPEVFDSWPEDHRREKWAYYREAGIYRVLFGRKGSRPDKRFSGFDTLALLSSGVIRYFQEILGVAYHLTFGTAAVPPNQLVIPVENQSKAVHFVSQHNLMSAII